MILFVSGRCDIVAFFSEWFMNRYKEGFLDVRNPFNRKLVSRIYFEDVDAILFCTKNPIPLEDKINLIKIPKVLHVTLTPYNKDNEPNVPDKSLIIDAIKKISKIIGKENIYIRYDPIFLSDIYDINYHKKAFSRLVKLLDGYTEHIIVSFIDDYKNVRKNMNVLRYHDFTREDFQEIGKYFSEEAKKYGMSVQTCFEDNTLVEYGFIKNECMSKELAKRLTGKDYKKWKARSQNKCECVQMVDIGVYNSCKHFCKYCYANFDEKKVLKNMEKHNPNSSLLIGELESDDVIKVRR